MHKPKTAFFAIFSICFALSLLGFNSHSSAQEEGAEPVSENPAFRSTDLPLPRFASLRSDKVFVRTGPGSRYPVKWVFEKKNLPVEIILEFDTWRKIRDEEGETGWVHSLLIWGKRSAVVQGQENEQIAMRDAPQEDAKVVAYLQPRVVARTEECRTKWCEISIDGYDGWVEKKSLWGVYTSEIFSN